MKCLIDFGLATQKFIDLKTEELRQNQFDESLDKIRQTLTKDNFNLVDGMLYKIANADDFIQSL